MDPEVTWVEQGNVSLAELRGWSVCVTHLGRDHVVQIFEPTQAQRHRAEGQLFGLTRDQARTCALALARALVGGEYAQ